MIDQIFRVLGAGLEVWNHHLKTKYQNKYYKLKKEYWEEVNKPMLPYGADVDDRKFDSSKFRDLAKLDNIEFELNLLVDSFENEIFKKGAKHE